jgi:aminopeptidase-like protein
LVVAKQEHRPRTRGGYRRGSRTCAHHLAQDHTSGDNLDFVKPGSLADSLGKLIAILDVLERDATFQNLCPKGEPQLGRRGLYRALAERTDDGSAELAMLWVLNQSDGKHSLLEIAERARMRFEWIANAAAMLAEAQLLERVGAHAPGRKTATSPPPGPVGSSF